MKDVEILLHGETNLDYLTYSTAGILFIFYAFGFIVFVLNLASIFFLFSPQRFGLPVLFSAICAAFLGNIVSLMTALFIDPVILRYAVTVSRESRGLQAAEPALDAMLSASGMGLMSGGVLLFYMFIAYLVYRSRRYFEVFREPVDEKQT